ncbi:MAG: ATP-dependent DNA helicase RecG [Gammaproteobacteria bacterium]|nr:ATP-dependent DNA helicase RecG [Gammaproteobacteria bacterium]
MSFPNPIYDDITYLKGVGPKRATQLKAYGINQVIDILYHLPRKYLDRRNIKKIRETKIGESAVVIGKIISKNVKLVGKRRLFQLTIADETGELQCIWFNALSWIVEKFNINEQIAVFGKIEFFNGRKINHPEFDILDDQDNLNTGQIIAMYSSSADLKTRGLDSRGFRKLIKNIIDNEKYIIEDFFSKDLIEKEKITSLKKALNIIHFPEDNDDIKKAMYRLKFNEHFFIQLLMALKRKNIKKNDGISFPNRGKYLKEIYTLLNFKLTDAQIRVLREIRADLKSEKPMNRLIQGDVGSGKTIVAILTAAIVINQKYQVALMAPTEILAEQHFTSIKKYCESVDITCEVLTSNKPQKEKKIVLNQLQNGQIQFIIGTHALIQDKVLFKKLGLIIIDEQHRFGVEHRKLLVEKALNPEILSMTATPIPRTLSITVHGDMDISIIDELPKNRLPIKTKVINPKQLDKIYKMMKNEMEKGGQCFVVYPLIDESEKLDLEAAKIGYEKLKKIFDQFNLGYIHGKMKKEEIDQQMKLMEKGEIDCLVSTTVIEVGINIPNATIMVIENAERFGMTQLHQLRGRIGRGTKQSTCILIKHKHTPNANKRLEIMENTNDGFLISDEDLKMRGPGDFFGTKQHGFIKSKVVDFSADGPIIRRARQQAFDIVSNDPLLKQSKHKKINELFKKNYSHMLEFVKIG